jgi:hypothetical protein
MSAKQVPCHDCEFEDRELERYIPCCIKCWTCRSCQHNPYRLYCCDTPPTSIDVLSSLEESTEIWQIGSVCILCGFLVTLILFSVMAAETHDVILTYPCITTMVWASNERCYDDRRAVGRQHYDCLQSYRRLEWHHPPESMHIFGHNIEETSCDWSGHPTPSCNEASPALLKDALGWLNITVSCWIHGDTGSYYRSILIAGDDTPFQSTKKYFISLLTFLGVFLCCCCVCTESYRLGHQYRTLIILTRIDRHRSCSYRSFLLAFRNPTPNTPLASFVNDCDHLLFERLIGSYITSDIQWHDGDQTQIIEVKDLTPLPSLSPPIITPSPSSSIDELHLNIGKRV